MNCVQMKLYNSLYFPSRTLQTTNRRWWRSNLSGFTLLLLPETIELTRQSIIIKSDQFVYGNFQCSGSNQFKYGCLEMKFIPELRYKERDKTYQRSLISLIFNSCPAGRTSHSYLMERNHKTQYTKRAQGRCNACYKPYILPEIPEISRN